MYQTSDSKLIIFTNLYLFLSLLAPNLNLNVHLLFRGQLFYFNVSKFIFHICMRHPFDIFGEKNIWRGEI